jgi:hypothetical protein
MKSYLASLRRTLRRAGQRLVCRGLGHGTGRVANGKRCKGRSDAARLLSEGNSSKGVSLRCGEGGQCCEGLLRHLGAWLRETLRTPWLATGCNKPVAQCAEKTVAVVRNHEGGTGLGGWYR